MTETLVSQLTLNDLRDLIRVEIKNDLRDLIRVEIKQALLELLGDPDPDEGLELREDFKQRLEYSLFHLQAGKPTVPAQTVAERLGLSW